MAFLSRSRKHWALEDEVEALRREIASLARTVSRKGAAGTKYATHEAGDLYDNLVEQIAHAMPVMRRQTRHLERTVRDHPVQTAAAVGLVALGIAAFALLSRR
jgi:hypothetical protein